MATRPYKPDAKFMQFSKKMATAVTIFWMFYRIANFGVAVWRPDIAKFLVDLSTGVDTVMIVNVGFYTGNSLGEKIAIAFGKRKSLYSSDDEDDDEDDDENNG